MELSCEKTDDKKSRDTVPLNSNFIFDCTFAKIIKYKSFSTQLGRASSLTLHTLRACQYKCDIN